MNEEEIQKISDINTFKVILKEQIFKLFSKKYNTLQSTSVKNDFDVNDIELQLSDDIIDYEINKFIIKDDLDDNCAYILKENLFRLVHSLANDMISKHLNKLVDDNKLKLCWDSKTHEFIWLINKEK